MSRDVLIVEDEHRLATKAADLVAEMMQAAVKQHGVFRIALAGGTTPRLLHNVLAGDPKYAALPWQHTDVFWGDERAVPPDHPDSNYRMALDTLLSKVPIDPARVYRVPAEGSDPQQAAARYERTIRSVFELAERALPRFDLILLGMGADGHTASLFPSSPALDERDRLVVAAWSDTHRNWRVTVTLPVLNAAAQVTFMVSGENKSAAVAAALAPPPDAPLPPAGLVQPVDGHAMWVVDQAASRYLQSSP